MEKPIHSGVIVVNVDKPLLIILIAMVAIIQ